MGSDHDDDDANRGDDASRDDDANRGDDASRDGDTSEDAQELLGASDPHEPSGAGETDDEDLCEPDVFGEEEEVPAAPRKARRLRLAPTLLLLGGGVWAATFAMRCSPGPLPADSLSVPPGGSEQQRADLDEATLDPDAPSPAMDAVDEPPDDGIVTRRERPHSDEVPTDEPAADQPPEHEPPTQDWAKDLERPDVVTYTVRHGGSIKNVANLFKIFHHEIVALNPSVGLDQALSPGTAVVVYRQQPGTVSQSVGIASGGTLEGGVPMLDGPGRVLKMIPWKGWATADTVATLDRVLQRWAADESHDQPVLVGNMSARGGGKLSPHSTHQSGRDVDLGYLQKLPKGEELNWREMTTTNLDARATWQLLRLLRATGKLEVVFIDSKIQKLLYEWARTDGGMSKDALRRWMEYPRTPPVRNAIIQHVAGHVDHLHARFKCQPHEKRCKSRRR